MTGAPSTGHREADAPGAAGRARQTAELTREDAANLRCDIERLLMICEALWSMVREQHGYSDEELYRRGTRIDLRDGRLDGRVAPGRPPKCPDCGRTMTKHRPARIYCGAPAGPDLFQRRDGEAGKGLGARVPAAVRAACRRVRGSHPCRSPSPIPGR